MRPEFRQSVRLIAVLAGAGLAIALVSIGLLYNVAIRQQGEPLGGMAQSYARLIEATTAHELLYGHYIPDTSDRGTPREAILKQIADAHALVAGAGKPASSSRASTA